jgi:ketosteroid isomerase-like protein
MTAVAEITQLLDDWSAAVRAHDLDGASRDRSPDIVMFDVPEPLQARAIDAYRDTWILYFGDEGSHRPGSGPSCNAPPMMRLQGG